MTNVSCAEEREEESVMFDNSEEIFVLDEYDGRIPEINVGASDDTDVTVFLVGGLHNFIFTSEHKALYSG